MTFRKRALQRACTASARGRKARQIRRMVEVMAARLAPSGMFLARNVKWRSVLRRSGTSSAPGLALGAIRSRFKAETLGLYCPGKPQNAVFSGKGRACLILGFRQD